MPSALRGLLAASCLLSATLADQTYLGFSTGAFFPDQSAKKQADFEKEFKTAASLVGAPGVFNAIRLYTNIQQGTENSPSEAFPAAIATNTSMLLGMWCSGTESIDKELAALKSAIDKYGDAFTNLVIAVSVGSEDLYRQSEPGVRNKAGIGNTPANIKKFIDQTRKTLADTPLAKKPIGHVDTYDQFANETNSDVLDAADFWGVNAFPYYEKEKGNPFSNSTNMFKADFDAVKKSAEKHGNKQIWVTETGWPYKGPLSGQAVASVDNAKAYWDNVGCGMLFGKVNTWWYALVDGNPANKEQFDISDNLSSTPRFDLTCPPPGTSSAGNDSTGSSIAGTASAGATSTSTSKPSAASGVRVPVAAAFVSLVIALSALLAI
jgi:glucan endo-1,3-beta-D-glucosidase